ncbi:MAG: Arc family DNA-binding protein [Gammaproteobacteria bacterium]|nr:Arc family DNA-binding protein [Gammaproteobacteria bacterium]MBT8105779.1 Arc family DNA-binding protein [Gammaproteobacteria bacterium]NNF48987.1 Arc family DNA-binding protein [Woeseiaceae bacterium]NNK25793.1 Arc family DNA-binding protein [Woeseiaceae bacterium]NNL63035.1 Arc family DNA-binding protein [Woeseiaceae bacterium]
MAARKSFALRIEAKTYEAMQRWAKDDLRSLNAQIEFVLREALRKEGRLKRKNAGDKDGTG